MNPKLSPAMLAVLRAIDAGEAQPKARRVTLVALWHRRLIEDRGFLNFAEMRTGDVVDIVPSSGWQLTNEGRLAVQHGRQMLSNRRPE